MAAQLVLVRDFHNALVTLGTLYVDGVQEGYTLEAPAKQVPAGRYPLKITHSSRFGRWLPELQGIEPGIRIHPGNTTHDTAGSILVGKFRGASSLYGSAAAMRALMDRLHGANTEGEQMSLVIK